MLSDINITILNGIIIGIIIIIIFSSSFNTIFSLIHNQELKSFISLVLFIVGIIGLVCYITFAPHFTSHHDQNMVIISSMITVLCGTPIVILTIKLI